MSPYLPYGLKICSQSNSDEDCIICEIGVTTKVNVFTIDYVIEYGYKPLLRPLSDLTKEVIDKLGASFVHHKYEPSSEKIVRNKIKTNTLYFRDAMILIENHYDIFGLIDAGLALPKTNN